MAPAPELIPRRTIHGSVTALPLKLLPEPLAIARLAADAEVPGWAWRGSFVSVTRTATELSVVASTAAVPVHATAERTPDGDFGPPTGPAWRALRVEGTLDFGLTGVLAGLAVPLADAGVSIFAVSTHDTDYVLVRDTQLTAALDALRRAGHTVT